MSKIGCVGGLTLDWVRRPSGTTGPSVGGNALYSAVGAWLAGGTPALCAVIGADFPNDALPRLADLGFDVECVRSVDGPSFRVLLDDIGPRRHVSYLPLSGRNETLDPLVHQIRPDWDAAHLSAIPTASQTRLAERLCTFGVPFTLDTIVIPGEVEPDRDSLVSLANASRAFLPSAEDVDELWPGPSTASQLEFLSSRISAQLVITCGPHGSIGCWDGQVVRAPAIAVQAVDTTGAGDAYGGAFAAASARGAGMAQAMASAAAAASIVIEGFGVDHALCDGARATSNRRAEMLLGEMEEEELDGTER